MQVVYRFIVQIQYIYDEGVLRAIWGLNCSLRECACGERDEKQSELYERHQLREGA